MCSQRLLKLLKINGNNDVLKACNTINKADLALPLFKTALEANPKIEQFWLSYIDALIKEKQFDNAKQVLEQAKTQGVAEEERIVLAFDVKKMGASKNM